MTVKDVPAGNSDAIEEKKKGISSIIYYLSFIIYYLLSIIYHLLSIIHYLLSIIHYLLSIIMVGVCNGLVLFEGIRTINVETH